MSGFFGVISKRDCVEDVFYGTDYHSHLGTKRAGMVFIVPGKGFRQLRNLVSEMKLIPDRDVIVNKLCTHCWDGTSYF